MRAQTLPIHSPQPALFKVLSSSLHLKVLLFSVCQTRLSHQVLPLFITFEIHNFQNYVLPSRFPDLSPEYPFLPLKLFLLWRDLDLFLQMRSKYLGSFVPPKRCPGDIPAWLGTTAPFTLHENQNVLGTSSLDSCLEDCTTFPPTISISY